MHGFEDFSILKGTFGSKTMFSGHILWFFEFIGQTKQVTFKIKEDSESALKIEFGNQKNR